MINKIRKEIFDFFPERILNSNYFATDDVIKDAEEVRIRIGQPVCIRNHYKETFSKELLMLEDVKRILENFSNNSIYSVQDEINSGFITIQGGHRIGITGTCVFENEKIKNIKYISSLNIRIAREVKECSSEVLDIIMQNQKFENTLILSPPGCGKTTLIRDMIRQLSNGDNMKEAYQIGLIDERAEIAAMYKGVPQNEIGKRTDVMNHCKKEIGMKMLIRSMGPQIIATDEIGGNKEEEAIFEAVYSGVKLLLTAHGEELKDVSKNMLESQIFKNIVILKNETKPGELAKIYFLEGNRYVSGF